MSNYLRARVAGGTYFFTVVTAQRRPLFVTEAAVAHLRAAFRTVRAARPFAIDAMVVLPDHLHCIWRLPAGDADYSSRWREIKKATSHALAPQTTDPRTAWQPRFWEHVIRDADDWQRHVEYIHHNPVKHGHARRPLNWPWSSFRRFVAQGCYAPDWGAAEPDAAAGLEP